MIVRFIDFLRARMGLVVKICIAILALVALWDAFLVDKEEAEFWFEKLPAFWSLFGFLSCVVIILFSKWFGHRGIMTREDYYDR